MKNQFRRILLYYLLGFAALFALAVKVPGVSEVFFSGQGPTASGGLADDITSTFAGTPLEETAVLWWGGETGTAFLSMLAALLIMGPVVSVYTLIKRKGGYDESVVHALLILPVAVTGIVMIVKGSVALAFSLAGIVAAVRFRTTLDDTKDAVYIFLAIGVGLDAAADR